MEQTDQRLEPRPGIGIVARLYTSWRYGIIASLEGERLIFWRGNVIGNADRWTPDVGEAVMFDRVLDRRGLKAFNVRPLNSRRRQPTGVV